MGRGAGRKRVAMKEDCSNKISVQDVGVEGKGVRGGALKQDVGMEREEVKNVEEENEGGEEEDLEEGDKSLSPGHVETGGTERARAGAGTHTHTYTHAHTQSATYERNTYISHHTKPALPCTALNEDKGHNRT